MANDDRSTEFSIDRLRQGQPSRVKHRRVKTGCFTCRERRVKCDEARPICLRFRNSNRECEYSTLLMEPTTDSQSPAPDSSPILKPVFDQIATPASDAVRGKQKIAFEARWESLSTEAKVHLTYYQRNMSSLHFSMWLDPADFFKTTFLFIALTDENQALLYSIVAIAAYYAAFDKLRQADAGAPSRQTIDSFMPYYNRAVNELQKSLHKKARPTPAILLSILTVAILEQNIGDWTSVVGHQRGAAFLIDRLYTPLTITRDPTGRMILRWFIKLDLFASTLGGVDPTLSMDWYNNLVWVLKREASERPHDLNAQFANFWGQTMLLMAQCTYSLNAIAQKKISAEEFDIRAAEHLTDMAAARLVIETAYAKEATYLTPKAPPPSADDIIDYRDPVFVYGGAHYIMNFALLYIWTVETLFQSKTMLYRPPKVAELGARTWTTSLQICKMFEALRHCDGPPGAWKVTYAYMSGTSFILGRDPRHVDWYCRHLAQAEKFGLIPVPKFRAGLSEVWKRDVTRWWLKEDPPDLILDIQDTVEGRDMPWADAASTQVNDMDGIFSSMTLDE